MNYREVNSNNISFDDKNHNVKNGRYQLMGGSYAAIIDLYCFDHCLLNISCVAKCLIRVEYFDFDYV